MPILPEQPDIFPAGLLDDPATVAGPGLAAARWVAFYTLARREKDLMRRLTALGTPFYAPLVRRRLRSAGGRTRMSHVPLFPGYVFSLVDEEKRRSALGTNTISCCLPIADGAALGRRLRPGAMLLRRGPLRPLGAQAALALAAAGPTGQGGPRSW